MIAWRPRKSGGFFYKCTACEKVLVVSFEDDCKVLFNLKLLSFGNLFQFRNLILKAVIGK